MIERRGEEQHRLFHIAKHDPEYSICDFILKIFAIEIFHIATHDPAQNITITNEKRSNLHIPSKKKLILLHPSVPSVYCLPAYTQEHGSHPGRAAPSPHLSSVLTEEN